MPIEIIDQGLARMNPLKRVGVPADIAKAVSLLVSPESEWINGALMKVPVCISTTMADHSFDRPSHQALRWRYIDNRGDGVK